MNRPVIGILLDYEAHGSFSTRPHYALRTAYFDAVWKAGGMPIAIPYIGTAISDFLSICHGLLFPGGFYPFPQSAYDNKSIEENPVHPRYKFESQLMFSALQANMPVLGICAGMQLMTSIHGGKLFRNILEESQSCFDHLNAAPAEKAAHKVNISNGTLLHKILGVGSLNVNTAHNESLKQASKALVINAVAPDGIVEGIEIPQYRFCLGVQWHPEFFAKDGDPNLNLFKSLVSFSQGFDAL